MRRGASLRALPVAVPNALLGGPAILRPAAGELADEPRPALAATRLDTLSGGAHEVLVLGLACRVRTLCATLS